MFDILQKCQTFTFCTKSNFSKNVNHILFEMPYLFEQLLDYKIKYINEKMKKNTIDMHHLLFQNFYKCKYIYIDSSEQLQKNSDIFHVEVNISIEAYSLSEK